MDSIPDCESWKNERVPDPARDYNEASTVDRLSLSASIARSSWSWVITNGGDILSTLW